MCVSFLSQYVTGYLVLTFHPMTRLSIQDVSHCSPASYDCVEMRMGTKDDSISSVNKQQVRCLCVCCHCNVLYLFVGQTKCVVFTCLCG